MPAGPSDTLAMTPVSRGLQTLRLAYASALALAAGALVPLSFAPFNLWPLSLVGVGLLALLLFQVPRRRAFWVAAAFGLGLYGVGVSWIFVAINQFGGASIWLAGLLTAVFVVFLAAIFAVPFALCAPLFGYGRLGLVLAFPACYLLGEWLRTWLMTGFPWLNLGYAHLHTPLAGWAPLAGVLGVSFITAFTSGALASWCHLGKPSPNLVMATLLAGGFWLGGYFLAPVSWTQINRDHPIEVAMVQPNIAQHKKWDSSYARPAMEKLMTMSEPLWGADWLIWPEAAIPLTYHRAMGFLDRISRRASETDTGLISGIIYDDRQKRAYYNSIAGFGDALGIYHKRRLVPFGEYVPLEEWLRGTIEFFDLPTSYISLGPDDQSGLQVGDVSIAPTVCYEIVYPDLVGTSARRRNVLLTVSNDAWFADSIGPLQHMQMAQMRARETGRYLVRATNNGVSALVGPDGRIIERSEQFVEATLTGQVYPAYGATPFMRWGSLPVVVLAAALLLGVWLTRRKL